MWRYILGLIFLLWQAWAKAQPNKSDTIRAIAEQFKLMPAEELQAEKEYIVFIEGKVAKDSLKGQDGSESNLEIYLAAFWYEYAGTNFLQVREEYLGRIAMANKLYRVHSISGFKSDRGRVLMIYGYPNDKNIVKNQPNVKPYEIWYYNRIFNGQSNVEFVFYNESRLINDFSLIHSNARGELMNVSWKNLIYYKDAPDMQKSDYHFFENQRQPRDF